MLLKFLMMHSAIAIAFSHPAYAQIQTLIDPFTDAVRYELTLKGEAGVGEIFLECNSDGSSRAFLRNLSGLPSSWLEQGTVPYLTRLDKEEPVTVNFNAGKGILMEVVLDHPNPDFFLNIMTNNERYIVEYALFGGIKVPETFIMPEYDELFSEIVYTCG